MAEHTKISANNANSFFISPPEVSLDRDQDHEVPVPPVVRKLVGLTVTVCYRRPVIYVGRYRKRQGVKYPRSSFSRARYFCLIIHRVLEARPFSQLSLQAASC